MKSSRSINVSAKSVLLVLCFVVSASQAYAEFKN